MRELSLDQLRTLVSIVDLGTFSAAAQALHLAQPTVSLHVSELEARLGTTLVLRGGRQVQPTPAGAALVERARRLLRDADEAADMVRAFARGRTGRVRLGTSTGLLVRVLPGVLDAMRKAHPEIDVELSVVGSADGQARMAAGTLDVALIAPPDNAADMVVTPWRRDPLMAFVPEDWKAPQRITPQWLADKPLILHDAASRVYRQTMEWFGAAGFAPRARIELNYDYAIMGLVGAGYGATILSVEGPASAHLIPGIRAVPLKPVPIRETVIVHRARNLMDNATVNLLRVLQQFRQA